MGTCKKKGGGGAAKKTKKKSKPERVPVSEKPVPKVEAMTLEQYRDYMNLGPVPAPERPRERL